MSIWSQLRLKDILRSPFERAYLFISIVTFFRSLLTGENETNLVSNIFSGSIFTFSQALRF